MLLAEAKTRLSILQLWARLGLPGKPSKSCRCPWRRDRHPSFSVFANGTRWKDHGTAEGGDVVDFFQRATGLSQGEACRHFIQLAMGGAPGHSSVYRTALDPVIPHSLPTLLQGTECDHLNLASSREVSCEAVELAVQRRLVYFGSYQHQPAWFLTDSSRRVIQARRMNQMNWWRGGPKAMTLPGGQGSWPVGASNIATFDSVLMTEGGADLLAAFHFLILAGSVSTVTAVAMLGAANNLHPDALALFSGKLIRIIAHLDKPNGNGRRVGIDAAERWQKQLQGAGANSSIINLREFVSYSYRIKDLNDATQLPLRFQAAIAKRLVGQ